MQKVGSADGALVSLIGVDKEQDVYDTVVDAVEGLLPGSMVIASALEPSGDSFRVVALAGLSSHIQTAVKLLGVDPTALSSSMDDMRPEDYRSGRLERVPSGIHTLALGKLPRPACAALERALGIGDVCAIGFAWDDFHYGGVSIGLPRGARLAHAEGIEVLVHQATIAIRRIRAERELQERTAELDVFFTESVDLLAVADMGGWLMLAFTIFVVVFLAHRLQDSSWEALTIAAEGLSIAAWVLLWHPLEALVFNRWDFRLDRRVLRTSGTRRRCAWTRATSPSTTDVVDVAAAGSRVLQCLRTEDVRRIAA